MCETELLKKGERLDSLECGELKIIQDKSGYTFTMDSVLLANFARAANKDTVVDLGTGSGVIPILMSAKTNAKKLIGVEIQERLYDMAARSVLLNGLSDRMEILNADIKNAYKTLGTESADVVVTNPPYKVFSGKTENASEKDICRSEVLITLDEILLEAGKLLKYGGNFFIIIKSDRLSDVIYGMRKYSIEPKRLTPVQPTPEKQIDTVIIEGKKYGKSGLVFDKPLLVSDSDGNYTEELRRIYKH